MAPSVRCGTLSVHREKTRERSSSIQLRAFAFFFFPTRSVRRRKCVRGGGGGLRNEPTNFFYRATQILFPLAPKTTRGELRRDEATWVVPRVARLRHQRSSYARLRRSMKSVPSESGFTDTCPVAAVTFFSLLARKVARYKYASPPPPCESIWHRSPMPILFPRPTPSPLSDTHHAFF